jgi:hypothetical protein
MNMPNTQTASDCVMARSKATRQSMRLFGLPRRCAPRNDDDLILEFPELLTAE